jgi:hypothetical protein
MESSPPAYSFVRLMSWLIVFGFTRPSVSVKSHRMRPSRKASIALSGEMFSAMLRRLSHQEIYECRVSLVFCTHNWSSSNDMGHLDVPRKLAMKACRNYSQEPMDPRARLLSHDLTTSVRCSCKSCRAFSLKPPLTMTVFKKSSSQILGSCCPLNLMIPSLILSPFGRGVVRMYRLKHSVPQSLLLLMSRIG